METTGADTRLLPFPAHPGTRYDADVRELARQLWAFRHGRNAEAVVRELAVIAGKPPADRSPADPEWPAGEPVPTARTVRAWAQDGRWAERVDAEIVALAPAIHAANVADLIAGSAEALAYLRGAVRGDRIAEPARVNAANSLLDRAGYRARDAPAEPDRRRDEPEAAKPADPIDRNRRRLDLMAGREQPTGAAS